MLTVTGERTITEQAPGLGGSFTYCTLGEPIEIENLLTGKGLPSFEALARYVFSTPPLDNRLKPWQRHLLTALSARPGCSVLV